MFVHKKSRLWMIWMQSTIESPTIFGIKARTQSHNLTRIWSTFILSHKLRSMLNALLTIYSIVLQLKTTPNLKAARYVPMVSTLWGSKGSWRCQPYPTNGYANIGPIPLNGSTKTSNTNHETWGNHWTPPHNFITLLGPLPIVLPTILTYGRSCKAPP